MKDNPMSELDPNRPEDDLTPAKLFKDAVDDFKSGDDLGKDRKIGLWSGAGPVADMSAELKPRHYEDAIFKAVRAACKKEGIDLAMTEPPRSAEDWEALAEALERATAELKELAEDVRALRGFPKSIEKDRTTALKVFQVVAQQCGFELPQGTDAELGGG